MKIYNTGRTGFAEGVPNVVGSWTHASGWGKLGPGTVSFLSESLTRADGVNAINAEEQRFASCPPRLVLTFPLCSTVAFD